MLLLLLFFRLLSFNRGKLNFFTDRDEKFTCNTEMRVCWPKTEQSSKQWNVKQYIYFFPSQEKTLLLLSLSYGDGVIMLFPLHSQMVILPPLLILFPLLQTKPFTYHTSFICPPQLQIGRLAYHFPHETSVFSKKFISCRHLLSSSFKMISTVAFFFF